MASEHEMKTIRPLFLAAILIAVVIVALTCKVLQPLVQAVGHQPASVAALRIPAFDVTSWQKLPVQEGGRIKPFATACQEAVRNITGTSRFEGNDAVAVVLMWKALCGTGAGTNLGDWESHPFILCQDQSLRRVVYRDQVEHEADITADQLYGKNVSPEDLRRSAGFARLLQETEELQEKYKDKASQMMSPEQRKAREVAGRLFLFDAISQNNPPVVGGNPPLRGSREDPFKLVALDRVPGGAWFSLPELRDCLSDPMTWDKIMRERVANAPQIYLDPESRVTLSEFQEEIKSGQAGKGLDELQAKLLSRTEQRLNQFCQRHKEVKRAGLSSFAHDELITSLKSDDGELDRLVQWVRAHGSKEFTPREMADELRDIYEARDRALVAELRHKLPSNGAVYQPDDPTFRMLHLGYLEAVYPDLYNQRAAWQAFPTQEAARVVGSYDAWRQAYRSGDAAAFARASDDFLSRLRLAAEAVGPYPGPDTIRSRVAGLFSGTAPQGAGEELLDLELRFDRLMPFRWAWILMLVAAMLLGTSLSSGGRFTYALGLGIFVVSIAFQLYGFFCRIVIAGRPPVGNMYETVIWVGFMSSAFALGLELVYRRKVILLAGSLAAALGLVLADQLPLSLDSRISPLVPVLRSNYWLTIHVLTIVSSYAAGTLAWGLGNLVLGLLAFGSPSRQTIRTLSQFTYSALKLAVLLLAAGTFLGAWWANEAWGRFWGWDAKEVWALIALVCYVIPLHARYIGWVRDFGLAVAAVVCYAAIVMSWYGVNFVLATGLHSYGFGGGGPWWIFWAGLINLEWVLIAAMLYRWRQSVWPIVPTRVDQVSEMAAGA